MKHRSQLGNKKPRREMTANMTAKTMRLLNAYDSDKHDDLQSGHRMI